MTDALLALPSHLRRRLENALQAGLLAPPYEAGAVPGLHARDTRRVYEELLGAAEHSAWVTTFAFFDGPRAFEVLAGRMDETPALNVTLLLSVQRRKGDTTSADRLVRQFADRFWTQEWPGTRRPRVFYDPRSRGCRRRRGRVRDVGQPDGGGARPEHRDRAARPRPHAGRHRHGWCTCNVVTNAPHVEA